MADGKEVKVVLRLDNGQYVAELQAAGRQHQVFSAQVTGASASASAGVESVADSLRDVGTATASATQAPAVLNQTAQSARQVSQAVSVIPQQLQGVAAQFQSTRAGLAGVSGQASALQASVSGATAPAQVLADTLTLAGSKGAAGLAQADRQTQNLGISAKQTAAAMRGVPAQITDIVVGLQGGQAPLTVMLQQGGQLKDMFGGTVPAVRALTSAVVGMVNPLTVAVGAAAVLAFAYQQGSSEADGYRQSIVMSGNAAGTSVGQMTDMARAISQVTGTQGAAAEALAQMAGSGAIARQNLQQFSQVAMGLEKYVGIPVKATVADLEQLGKAPLQASVKLNEQYRYLTATVYDQIRALDEQGKKEEAGAVAQKAYAAAMEARKSEIVANLGSIERGWNAVAGAAKKGWDAILGVGRQDSAQKQLDDTSTKIAKLREQLGNDATAGFSETGGGAAVGVGANVAQARRRAELDMLVQQQAALQETVRLEQRGADAAALRAKEGEAAAEWGKIVTANKTKEKQQEEEITRIRNAGKAAGKEAVEIEKEIAAYRAKNADKGAGGAATRELERQRGLLGELAGLSSTFYKDWEGLNKQFKQGKLTQDQLTQAQEALLAKQPAMKKKQEEEEEAEKRMLKVLQAQYAVQQQISDELAQAEVVRTQAVYSGRQAVTDYAKGIDEATRFLEVERQTVTGTASQRALAVEHLRIELELEKQLQSIRENAGFTQANRDEQIAKAKAAAAQARTNATSRAELDHAQELRTELQRVTEQYEQGLTNAAMQGGKSLKEYVQGMLRTTAFRIVLQPVMNLGAQALAALTGTAGKSGGIDLASLISNGTSLYGAATGNGFLGSAVNTVGGWLGFGGAAATTGLGLSAAAGAGAIGSGIGASLGLGSAAASAGTGLGLSLGGTGLGLSAGSAGAGAIGAGLGTSAAAAGGAAATTGLAGSITSAIAAVPVWGWIAAAVMAVGAALSKKPTPHSGGAVYSDPGLTAAINPNDKDPIGFSSYVDKETLAKVTSVASNAQAGLNAVLSTGTSKSPLSVLTGFADDKSKDGAWGQLIIKKLDATVEDALVNWEKTRTEKWAPKVFADGEEGFKQYQNAVAADSIAALKSVSAELPAWTNRMVAAANTSGENTAEVFAKLVTDISEYPAQILTRLGTSGEALTQLFVEGLRSGDPAAAGENFAQGIVGGIESALVGNLGNQVQSLVTSGMVTPFVDSLLNGATAAEALAAMSTEATLARVKAQATAFKEIWGNADFQAALEELRTTISSTTSAAVTAADYTPRYTAAIVANTTATQAGTDAQREAEDAAKRIAEERKTLQDQIDQLTMTRAELLGKEREALDASNRDLFDRLTLLQRQAALQEGIAAVSERYMGEQEQQNTRYAQMAQVLQSAGVNASQAEIEGLLRAGTKEQFRELATWVTSAGDSTLGLQEALVQIAGTFADVKDAARALAQEQRQALMSQAQSLLTTSMTGVERAANAQKETLAKNLQTARESLGEQTAAQRESVSKIKGIFDEIKNAIKSTEIETDALSRARRSAALTTLQGARDQAQQGISIASIPGVSEALGVLSKPSDKLYGRFEDYSRAQDEAADAMRQLGSQAGGQLSVAEMTLKAGEDAVVALEKQYRLDVEGIDRQVAKAREQVDELRGIRSDTSDLNKAMGVLAAAIATVKAASGVTGIAPSTGYTGDSQAVPGYSNGAVLDAVGFVKDSASKGDLASIYQGAVANNLSAEQVATLVGLAGYGGVAAADVRKYVDQQGWAPLAKNQFASGGAFTNGIVQRPTAFDMGLMGEVEPEGILPLANINGKLGVRSVGGGMESAAIVAAIQELGARLAAIETNTEAGATHAFNGAQASKKILDLTEAAAA